MIYYDNVDFASYQRRCVSFFIDNAFIYSVAFLFSHLFSAQINSRLSILCGRIFLEILANILIFPILQSSSLQASIGEILLGIKIIDKNGCRVGFWRAAYRRLILYFCPWGTIFFFFLPNKQCLHDYLSDTLVVSKNTIFNHYKLPLKKIRFSLFLLYFLLVIILVVEYFGAII